MRQSRSLPDRNSAGRAAIELVSQAGVSQGVKGSITDDRIEVSACVQRRLPAASGLTLPSPPPVSLLGLSAFVVGGLFPFRETPSIGRN